MFTFEREPLWNEALNLADYLSLLTNQIAKKDQPSLGEGIRRSSVSLITNLSLAFQCETTSHEAKYFFQLTETSIYKIVALLKLSFRREYITFEEYKKVHDDLEEMSTALSKMYNRMEK